jgi:hypothetical protein
MDGDLVDEGTGRPLAADQDADRVGARERNHAAAAPHLQVADRPLERCRRHRRLVLKVRKPAAIQRVAEKPDIIGATKAVRAHSADALRAVIGLTSFRLCFAGPAARGEWVGFAAVYHGLDVRTIVPTAFNWPMYGVAFALMAAPVVQSAWHMGARRHALPGEARAMSNGA